MIETLLVSTVLPAVLLGAALVLCFWTSFYERHRTGAEAIVAVVATAGFAIGHVALNGFALSDWAQAVPFILWLTVVAGACEILFRPFRPVLMVAGVALVALAVWMFSAALRSDGGDHSLPLAITALVSAVPMLSFIWFKPQVGQLARLGWVVSLVVLSAALTLAGSALAGQLTGVVVALLCAYLSFSVFSAAARRHTVAHFIFMAASLSLLLLGHFLVDIPLRSLIAIGASLTLSPPLGALFRRGWGVFLLMVVAIVLLNTAAIYWVAVD